MVETIPHITKDSWKQDGVHQVAWITDQEFFQISPHTNQEDTWFLYYNNIGTGEETYLGVYGRCEDAQGAAKTWIGDDEGLHKE